ncbi:MAG: hypothetical protein ACRC10_04855 [Thermoguttaceae bacterium]
MFKHLFLRLLLLASLLACLWFARNPITHFTLLQLARAKAGVDLSIGSTQLEPFAGTLRLVDVKIPDPQKPNQELATVDSVFVSLNTYELLKRQYHVENTEIRGIHYKTQPSENELFIPQKMWERFQNRFPNWVGKTFNLPWNQTLFAGPNSETLTVLKEEFQSAQLAHDLSEKWTAQTQPIIEQSQNLAKKVQTIRDSIQSQNPQANTADVVLGILQQSETLDADIQQIANSAASLRTLAQQDAGSLRKSFQEDLAKVSELKIPTLDAQFVSEVLIGPEIRDRFTAMLAWADSLGSQLTEQTENLSSLNGSEYNSTNNTTNNSTNNPTNIDSQNTSKDTSGLSKPNDGTRPLWSLTRTPGSEVRFASLLGKPEVLVSRTYFDGDVTWNDMPIYFVGRVSDIAVSPKEWEKATTLQLCIDTIPVDESVLGESPIQPEWDLEMNEAGQLWDADQLDNPIKAQMLEKMTESGEKTDGSFPRIYVAAILNRKGEHPKDRFYLACPEYRLPRRILGDPNQFALSVSPGLSQFFAELEIEGDQLVGKVYWTQSDIRLTPSLPESLHGSEIERLLAVLTQNINTIDSVMTISGTKTDPQFAFQSDLGDRISGQLIPVLQEEWNRSKQVLTEQLNVKMDESLNSLDSLFQQQLDPIVNDLRTTNREWEPGNQQGYLGQSIQTLWGALSPEDQNRVQQRLTPEERRQLIQETAGNVVRGVLQDLRNELQKPDQPNEDGKPQPIQNRLLDSLMKRL